MLNSIFSHYIFISPLIQGYQEISSYFRLVKVGSFATDHNDFFLWYTVCCRHIREELIIFFPLSFCWMCQSKSKKWFPKIYTTLKNFNQVIIIDNISLWNWIIQSKAEKLLCVSFNIIYWDEPYYQYCWIISRLMCIIDSS